MWLKVAVRNSFGVCSSKHMGMIKFSGFLSGGSQRLMMILKPGFCGQVHQSISQFSSLSALLSSPPSATRMRLEGGFFLTCLASSSSSLPWTTTKGTTFAFSSSSVSLSGIKRDGSYNSIDNSQTIRVSKEGLKSKEQVDSFLQVLSEEQRTLLYQSLHLNVLRDKYMSELAAESHYLSKFGRPATSPTTDATGTLSEISPKWLHSRLELGTEHVLPGPDEEKLRPVLAADLWAVGLKNALPFVGFGFLDNLIMILAGDYIDLTIGAALGISTMAAAALGNTISDVAGIASAWYVEFFAEKVGIRDPIMTAAQQTSMSVRWSSNIGRAVGVVIGCLLGMIPLLFLPSAEMKAEEKEKKAAAVAAAATANSLTDSSSAKSNDSSSSRGGSENKQN